MIMQIFYVLQKPSKVDFCVLFKSNLGILCVAHKPPTMKNGEIKLKSKFHPDSNTIKKSNSHIL